MPGTPALQQKQQESPFQAILLDIVGVRTFQSLLAETT
jgi:hypothetical protein